MFRFIAIINIVFSGDNVMAKKYSHLVQLWFEIQVRLPISFMTQDLFIQQTDCPDYIKEKESADYEY